LFVRTPFEVACYHLEVRQYNAVLPYLDKQMALGSGNVYLKETLLLRATFRVCAGLHNKAELNSSKLMGIKDLLPRVGQTGSVCSSLFPFELVMLWFAVFSTCLLNFYVKIFCYG